jgi:hypothetical protein
MSFIPTKPLPMKKVANLSGLYFNVEKVPTFSDLSSKTSTIILHSDYNRRETDIISRVLAGRHEVSDRLNRSRRPMSLECKAFSRTVVGTRIVCLILLIPPQYGIKVGTISACLAIVAECD